MGKVHVCLVSDQPIPNIIPAISEGVQKVELLVSRDMERKGKWLRQFFEARGIGTASHTIDPYDFSQVEGVCSQLLDDASGSDLALNVTGGTKIAAFAAFSAFRDRNRPILYYDPKRWCAIRLDRNDIPPVEGNVRLSVKEYLNVYGKSIIEESSDHEPLCRRKGLTFWLAENLANSPFLRVMNAFAAEAQKSRSFPFSKSFDKRFNPSFKPLLERCGSEGIIGWDPKTRTVTFPDMDSARYLGGFWLEEYVWLVASELPLDDLKRNVRVKWEESGITNEFDVLFTYRCRLFIVSCKTSRLESEQHFKDKNPVYELDSQKEKAAGLFGKAILVSATPMGEELQKRADELKIIRLSGADLPWLKKKLEIAIAGR